MTQTNKSELATNSYSLKYKPPKVDEWGSFTTLTYSFLQHSPSGWSDASDFSLTHIQFKLPSQLNTLSSCSSYLWRQTSCQLLRHVNSPPEHEKHHTLVHQMVILECAGHHTEWQCSNHLTSQQQKNPIKLDAGLWARTSFVWNVSKSILAQ